MADGWLDQSYSLAGKRIWVAGYRGMVGSATVRRLEREDCEIIKPKKRVDLRDQYDTRAWVKDSKPDVIVLAAAKVGGIEANRTAPADFLYDNLMIETNIISAAHVAKVEKLLFLGSSCIYPKDAAQPIAEDALLTGPLEPTNEAYALAKIAGIKLCQSYRAQHGCDFVSVMPCNLYGPGDTYNEQISHVIPALLMKALRAKGEGAREWNVWGSGTPMREFLHVDDLADALVFVLKNYSASRPINIGFGQEISIGDLAALIAKTVGLKAEIVFDPSKPDGTMKKLLDSSRIFKAGWSPQISLKEGLMRTYDSLENGSLPVSRGA